MVQQSDELAAQLEPRRRAFRQRLDRLDRRAREDVVNARHDIRGAAGEAVERVTSPVKQAAEHVRDPVQKHPYATVAGAGAAGLGLGLLTGGGDDDRHRRNDGRRHNERSAALVAWATASKERERQEKKLREGGHRARARASAKDAKFEAPDSGREKQRQSSDGSKGSNGHRLPLPSSLRGLIGGELMNVARDVVEGAMRGRGGDGQRQQPPPPRASEHREYQHVIIEPPPR